MMWANDPHDAPILAIVAVYLIFFLGPPLAALLAIRWLWRRA
jgi:hypothetical protein